MNINFILLIFNSIIFILHPIKHIPQIIHTVKTKRANDISKVNIICEFILNIMSLISSILVYIYMGKHTFFVPILIEKLSSTIFIITIYCLRMKYSYDDIPCTNEETMPLNYKSFDNIV